MVLIDQTPPLSATLTFMSRGALFVWGDCNERQKGERGVAYSVIVNVAFSKSKWHNNTQKYCESISDIM